MKKATCKNLGGACDEVITGETSSEMGENSKNHVMQRVQAGDEAQFKSDDPAGVLGLRATAFYRKRAAGVQLSRISKSCVIWAVLLSIIDAEQYFSAESLIARATCSAFKSFPVTMKCM